MQFPEIQQSDFTTFKAGVQLGHVSIEQFLIDVGGKGIKGAEYKAKVLAEAGWKYGKLVSYGAHPEVATQVFTKVREVLGETQDKEEIITRLH